MRVTLLLVRGADLFSVSFWGQLSSGPWCSSLM
jgi:hypothetical protein